MCEALRELMRDELKAERLAGEEQVNKLILKLSEQNRMEDIVKAAGDKEYQKALFEEFGL